MVSSMVSGLENSVFRRPAAGRTAVVQYFTFQALSPSVRYERMYPMSRRIRVEFPGACYHLMSYGVHGAPAFVDNLDHRTFLDSLKEFVAVGKLIVFAFVLIRTHFHLLLQTPLADFSRRMRRLLGRYIGWFNRRHHRHSHAVHGGGRRGR
jgi:hypothetical protein